MAEIKSLSAISDKWARVTPARAEDYKLGIANPKSLEEAIKLAAKLIDASSLTSELS